MIAGPPQRRSQEGETQRGVRERGLEDAVAVNSRYLPNEEVRPLMELASFVVLPYTSATQSGVLHVAYACGRPVVATRVGGLPEVVEEGGTGRVVPPKDPAALADAIVAMLDDPEGTARMGERARHLAETRFSWASVAREDARDLPRAQARGLSSRRRSRARLTAGAARALRPAARWPARPRSDAGNAESSSSSRLPVANRSLWALMSPA